VSRRRKGGLPPGKLSLTGARKRLGITRDAIVHLVVTGQIPYHEIDGHRYIDEAVVDAIVDRALSSTEQHVEDRRSALRGFESMMLDHGARVESGRVRQRAGTDEHLEIGATATQLQSAHHCGPRVGMVAEVPRRCASAKCQILFTGSSPYCSRDCAQADRGCARKAGGGGA